jgi:hypothetical protein
VHGEKEVIVRRNAFGQLEPASTPTTPPGQFSLTQYFLTAVAAGVTVWLITRMLDGRKS